MKTLYEDLIVKPELAPKIKTTMEQATIYRISNVSQYMAEHHVLYAEVLDKYPIFTPPTEISWVEFTDGDFPDVELGYLCVRQEYEGSLPVLLPAEFRFKDIRWMVSFVMFHRRKSDPNIIPLSEGVGMEAYHMLLDKEGKLIREGEQYGVFGGYTPEFEKVLKQHGNPLPEKQAIEDLEWLATVLFGICLMHCKNVVIESVEPFHGEKKKRNRHNQPKVKYKVLKIKPMGVSLRGVGQYTGGSTPSMHIRRGHFKQFTEDKPLFGRWTGLYWWEAAVIAKDSKSKVLKDYDVQPPADDYTENQEQND